jgi:hypothetical protein
LITQKKIRTAFKVMYKLNNPSSDFLKIAYVSSQAVISAVCPT